MSLSSPPSPPATVRALLLAAAATLFAATGAVFAQVQLEQQPRPKEAAASIRREETQLPQAPEPASGGVIQTFAGKVRVQRASPGSLPLSLDDAIALALKHNVQIAIARENQRRVTGLQSTVIGNLLPTLSAQLYTRTQQINLAAMGFKPESLGNLLDQFGPPGSFKTIVKVDTTAAQLNVSQQLFNVPAFYLYRAARSAGTAAELGTLTVQGGVVQATGTQYLRILADAAEIENARALERADQAAFGQARDARAAGVATHLDELRAQVQLQTQQQAVIRAQNTYDKDRIDLNRLLELPAEQQVDLLDKAPYAELQRRPLPEILALAFTRRKDYLSLLAQQDIAERTQKAIKYQRLPTLAVGGFYGVLGETRGLYHGVFTAQGSLRFPIFREAEFRGEQEIADAQLSGLRNQISSLRQTVEAQIRSSLLDVETAQELVRVSRSNVELARQELGDAQERFLAGVTDNLPAVQAQATLAAAESRVVQTTFQFNEAKLALARNTGVVETQYRSYLGR